MSKKLLAAMVLLLLFLAFGTVLAPESPMFWLASSAVGYQIARFGLMLVLLLQLGTNPPRHKTFRIFSGWVAGITAFWVLNATYGNNMEILDSLSLLGAAVAIGLTALERTIPVRTKLAKPIGQIATA
jgi:hypothetical protein